MYTIRILASMCVVSLWVQIFFWFRLFDSTAQYVDLVIQTVVDIGQFMKILVLLLLTFSSGVYMIQVNRIETSYGANLENVFAYDQDSNLNLFWEAFMFQYKLLLGEFEGTLRRSYDGLGEDMKTVVIFENILVTLYFLGTTFFTQITILNMLIAIMSATYTKHS